MNISGSWDDFTNPLTTLTGKTIDSETFNFSNGIFWHILWTGLGVFWIGYFVAKPMFLPRSRVLLAYGDELLTSPTDRKFGMAMAILTCAIVWGGYRYTESVHPVSYTHLDVYKRQLYSRGTSFPLVMAIAGPLMILPNVGLNEWGHAFWFMEELFSAPLHWGFVILGWAGLFSGGIAAQIITRYSNLTDVIWNNQSKEILNNRIVP